MSHPPSEDDAATGWLDAQRRSIAALGGAGGGLDGLARAWSDSMNEWLALTECAAGGEVARLCREAVEQTGGVARVAEALAGASGTSDDATPAMPWLSGLAAGRAAAEAIARAAEGRGGGSAPAAQARYRAALAEFQAESSGLVDSLAANAWPLACAGGDAPSLRALYERWLEEGDRIWLEHVSTEDFARALGGLVNAALALEAARGAPGAP